MYALQAYMSTTSDLILKSKRAAIAPFSLRHSKEPLCIETLPHSILLLQVSCILALFTCIYPCEMSRSLPAYALICVVNKLVQSHQTA